MKHRGKCPDFVEINTMLIILARQSLYQTFSRAYMFMASVSFGLQLKHAHTMPADWCNGPFVRRMGNFQTHFTHTAIDFVYITLTNNLINRLQGANI